MARAVLFLLMLILATTASANTSIIFKIHGKAWDEEDAQCSGACRGIDYDIDTYPVGVQAGAQWEGLPYVNVGAAIEIEQGVGLAAHLTFPIHERFQISTGYGLLETRATARWKGAANQRDRASGGHLFVEAESPPFFVRWSRYDVTHDFDYREEVGTGPDGQTLYADAEPVEVDNTIDSVWAGVRVVF